MQKYAGGLYRSIANEFPEKVLFICAFYNRFSPFTWIRNG